MTPSRSVLSHSFLLPPIRPRWSETLLKHPALELAQLSNPASGYFSEYQRKLIRYWILEQTIKSGDDLENWKHLQIKRLFFFHLLGLTVLYLFYPVSDYCVKYFNSEVHQLEKKKAE